MAELAAACGVIGTGFGIWWADALAVGIVSLDILRDGVVNVWAAVTDLIDEEPKTTTDSRQHDRLTDRLTQYLASFDWVESAEVRMREEGHVFFGEAFVVPKSDDGLTKNIADMAEKARSFDWRVHDLSIMPVRRDALERRSRPR